MKRIASSISEGQPHHLSCISRNYLQDTLGSLEIAITFESIKLGMVRPEIPLKYAHIRIPMALDRIGCS